jgi:hypothetical protein
MVDGGHSLGELVLLRRVGLEVGELREAVVGLIKGEAPGSNPPRQLAPGWPVIFHLVSSLNRNR